MSKDKEIFTKSFNGSIDELESFTQQNADFVKDVIDGKADCPLSDEEALVFVKEDFKEVFGREIDDAEAKEILQTIKMDYVQETIDKLIIDGLVQVKEYDENGHPLFGMTAEGEILYKKIKDAQLAKLVGDSDHEKDDRIL
jgi:hypothetical protein